MSTAASPSQRFSDLHSKLYANFRKNNITLQAVNSGMSAVSLEPEQALVIAYVRLHSEAQSVQRQIGITSSEIDIRRHPLIELRLTESYLALEFVLSPLAWWDQRNLIGKLSVARHRQELRDLLLTFPSEVVIGHWHGIALDEQHLTMQHLRAPRVMDAWLQTFSDGRDPLRIGLWLGADALDSKDTPAELCDIATSLYGVYRFLAWTGRNDFQVFYDLQQQSL